MFKRVLIANRGEVCRRILRTLKNMGLTSVVIYSEADKNAAYLEEADIAVNIGGHHAKESYLNQDVILGVAKKYECEALHPGFGFLSENALFAERCNNINIKFIGPSAYHISLMGDKNKARKTFRDLGFPVIMGSKDILRSKDEAMEMAKAIGYPLLLKAKAGGGGKGMRLVFKENELIEKFQDAQNEAQSAFNDPLLYMEKYIEEARHIEFQVLADSYNNILILGERECSVQRNNQKLIEEALANNFTESLRKDITYKLKKAIKQISYTNAGTVEMLLDKNNNIYFMEMNTRLQVEHPVTEELTHIDIVKEQIKIAANYKLDIKEEDIKFSGHAIEFRINAEDPNANFKPCPGKIIEWVMPKNVRIETHAYEGYEVSPFYDSMLLKLIVWGEDREEALKKAKIALHEMKISGIKTTLDFHKKIIENHEFLSGHYNTELVKKIF